MIAWRTGSGLAAAVAIGLGLAASTTAGQQVTVRPSLEGPERLRDWTLDGTGIWTIANGALVLATAGKPGGPIRRPAALAILQTEPFTGVTLEAEVRSTAPADLDVRDVLMIVGYESPTRFYYVHLSGRTDAVHNGIFLVADADRRRLDAGTTPPQLKDLAWHRVRVERDPASGRLDVFVNDAGTPVLRAIDTTIRAGRVGVGSFDETGEFRSLVVTGTTQ
ncbi:MAG TPA: hypothetical protein VD833_17820 [Vicinamibacterales bacterium]|nr:hypothetical protein [Vicinamibacterales bacterium]